MSIASQEPPCAECGNPSPDPGPLDRSADYGDLTMLKRITLLLLTATLLLLLTGCNTLHGFGQDMEAVGEGIQDMTDQ